MPVTWSRVRSSSARPELDARRIGSLLVPSSRKSGSLSKRGGFIYGAQAKLEELEAENERLRSERDESQLAYEGAVGTVKNLKAENERLRGLISAFVAVVPLADVSAPTEYHRAVDRMFAVFAEFQPSGQDE
jgi:hypothetical protein